MVLGSRSGEVHRTVHLIGVCAFVAVVSAMLMAPKSAAAQASFEILPFTDNRDDSENFRSLRVSGDGRTVLGWQREYTSSVGRFRYVPVRWDEGAGATSLLDETLSTVSGAYGISADGSSIVGYFGSTAPGASEETALRLRSGGATVVASQPDALGWDASANGDVVVGGLSRDRGAQPGQGGFVWDAANGTRLLDTLGGSPDPLQANAISDDGTRVVGAFFPPDPASPFPFASRGRAYAWTEVGGLQELPGLVEGGESRALQISGDGSTPVGFASFGSPFTAAVFWDEADDIFIVPDAPTTFERFGLVFEESIIPVFSLGASFDGSTIVGAGVVEGFGRAAWIHDRDSGETLDLRSLLVGLGVNGLDEWELDTAVDVSSDGRVITGWARRRSDLPPLPRPRPGGPFPITGSLHAFRAVIPEPSTALLLGLGLLGLATRRRGV